MIKFEEVDFKQINEDEFNNFSDKLIFQTKEWLKFIMETQNVQPIVLRIFEEDVLVGYFTGFLFSKFGIKIIGSPFRGWTTLYMGFNIKDECMIERASLVAPLWVFLKKKYKCIYCEIIDRYITGDKAKEYGLKHDYQGSLLLNINGTDEQLLKTYTKHCRKHIRQFEKDLVTIEIVEPTDEYAEEFYNQLTKVFSYQGLLPSYDLKRVKTLFNALKDKHDLMCTRVIENDTGKWISSLISFGFNTHCYTWASTSLREGCEHRQSEGQRWFAIKYWRDHGYADLDMVGIREYKLKFNPTDIQIPRIILTKYNFLIWGRNLAQKFYWVLNSIKGKIKKG